MHDSHVGVEHGEAWTICGFRLDRRESGGPSEKHRMKGAGDRMGGASQSRGRHGLDLEICMWNVHTLPKVDNEGVWEYANKNGKSYKALCKFVKSRYICREGNTGGLEEGQQQALVSPTTMRGQRFRNSKPKR